MSDTKDQASNTKDTHRRHRGRTSDTPDQPAHRADSPGSSSSCSSTWDIVEKTPPDVHRNSTSAFPEFDAAFQSASSALSTVTTASSHLAATLSRSGLSHTGRSIGTAIATTANRSASSFANWAVNRAGADPTEFPRGVQEWLAKTDAPGRGRKRRATDMGDGSAAHRTEPLTFGDERGAFVIDTRYIDDGQSLLGPRKKGDRRASAPVDHSATPPLSVTSSEDSLDGETEHDSFIGGTRPSDIKSSLSVLREKSGMQANDGWIPAATSFDPRPSANMKGGNKEK